MRTLFLIATLLAGLAGPVAAQYDAYPEYAPENLKALAAIDAESYDLAVSILTPLAAQGDARALSNLGVLVQNGLGVAQDLGRAADLFAQAADAGFAPGQFNLAEMYRNGAGVEQDPEAAFRLYRASAAQGYLQAQIALVRAYSTGQGVARDVARAYMWMRVADQSGDPDVQRALDRMEAEIDTKYIVKGEEWVQPCLDSGLTDCG